MAMNMLAAGGLPAFTDGLRESDASNPRGYFEHDRVRRLATDSEWVSDADGHAVKIVVPLAVHLPVGPQYLLVLMERDLDEIISSQEAMLGRSGKATPTEAAVLRPAYRRFVRATEEWADGQANVSLLRLAYSDVLQDPMSAAERMAAFAGSDAQPLDPRAMAQIVEPALYRERSTSI